MRPFVCLGEDEKNSDRNRMLKVFTKKPYLGHKIPKIIMSLEYIVVSSSTAILYESSAHGSQASVQKGPELDNNGTNRFSGSYFAS